MPCICNRFDERLANNGKITTFTWVPLFDVFVRRFPWACRKSRHGPSKSTFKAEHFICSLSMSSWIDFGAIRSLDFSRSPKLPKIHKNPYFGVQGHPRSLNSAPLESAVYGFLLVINSNLCPISHGYWDTATYWLKIANFSTLSHLAFSFGVTPFEFIEMLYGFWN